MTRQLFLAAWAVSIVASIGVYYLCRFSLATRDRLLFAAVCFLSPLGVAIGGRNSLIYAIDVCAPLVFYWCWRIWPAAPVRIRDAAIFLFVAGGVIPTVVTFVFSGERNALLFNVVNLYRLAACMAVLIYFSSIPRLPRVPVDFPMRALAWIAIVLLAAFILQEQQILNSNVFEMATGGQADTESYGVAGLFRGSLGILGFLAATVLLVPMRGANPALRLLGGLAGLGVIVVVGSKTSLLTFAGVAVARLLLFRRRGAVVAAIAITVLVASYALVKAPRSLEERIPRGLRLMVESGGRDVSSYDTRTARWTEGLGVLSRNPWCWLGLVPDRSAYMTSAGNFFVPGTFHNEYLAIVGLGGVWSVTPYLLGIGLLGRFLIRRAAGAEPLAQYALLVFVGGLVHGLAVTNFLPGLFYVVPVGITCAVLGLALRTPVDPFHPARTARFGDPVAFRRIWIEPPVPEAPQRPEPVRQHSWRNYE